MEPISTLPAPLAGGGTVVGMALSVGMWVGVRIEVLLTPLVGCGLVVGRVLLLPIGPGSDSMGGRAVPVAWTWPSEDSLTGAPGDEGPGPFGIDSQGVVWAWIWPVTMVSMCKILPCLDMGVRGAYHLRSGRLELAYPS